MQNKSITTLVVVLLVLVVVGFFFFQNKDDGLVLPNIEENNEVINDNGAAGGPAGSATPNFEGLTAEVVAEHNIALDCWVTVNGSVYDITSWIAENQSLSGSVIKYCGTDASADFNAQAQGSVLASETLALYRIGAFVE